MELRALRYFVTVAEELHFGRAAERLHVVQPAVSQQVARLERELGVRLLDRSPRSVALTPAGSRVLAAAREALAAAGRVREAVAGPAAVVRIGTETGLTGRLERGVERLRESNPDFEVVLVDLPLARRLAALRDGELDLVLVRGPVSAPGLRAEPAWTEPLHAVLSDRHPAAGQESVRLADLGGDLLRLPSEQCDPALRDTVLGALRAAGVPPRLGRRSGTAQDTIVEVGADPGSWAVLPAAQLAASGSTRVRGLPFDPPLLLTGTVLTRAGDRPCVRTAVDAFRDELADHTGIEGIVSPRGFRRIRR